MSMTLEQRAYLQPIDALDLQPDVRATILELRERCAPLELDLFVKAVAASAIEWAFGKCDLADVNTAVDALHRKLDGARKAELDAEKPSQSHEGHGDDHRG